MALSYQAALSKDKDSYAPMQHRHYATVANCIRRLREEVRYEVAMDMAYHLSGTNPKFNKERFLACCGYEPDTLKVMAMVAKAAGEDKCCPSYNGSGYKVCRFCKKPTN